MLKVQESDARALLKAVGFNAKIVDEFMVDRLKAKLDALPDHVDGSKKPKDKAMAKLFADVMTAAEDADEEITVVPAKKGVAKPAPAAAGKASGKKKPQPEPEEDEGDADEEEEEGDGDSEEDEDDGEEDESDEGDSNEDAEDSDDEAGEEDEDDDGGEDNEEGEEDEEEEIVVGSTVGWTYKKKQLQGEVNKIQLRKGKGALVTVEDENGKKHFVDMTELVLLRSEEEEEAAEEEEEAAEEEEEAAEDEDDGEYSLVDDESEEEADEDESDDEEESDDSDEDAEDEDDTTDSSDEDEEEEDDMEPVTKKPAAKKPAGKPVPKKVGVAPQSLKHNPGKKKKTGQKAAPFRGAGGEGKPGVIESIAEFLSNASEQKPLTKPQIVAMVLKRFPAKKDNVAAVESTVSQNVPTKLRIRGYDVRKNERGFWIKAKKK